MFFAAYYRATKDTKARELALTSLAPVCREIDRLAAIAKADPQDSPTIGGLIGLGSFLYALTASADWLNAPELLDAASILLRVITPELIRTDRKLDIMRGCAGTLLALLFFAQETKARGMEPELALDLALACGQHLLRSRLPEGNGQRGWLSIHGSPLPGFARGAAGISYALAKLYEQTKKEEFREAAFEGFAFERAFRIPGQQAWDNARSLPPKAVGSWCHGFSGTALSCLASIRSMDEPAIRHDLEAALSTIRALPESEVDQLCCGNFGRIDVLHMAGSVLGRLQLSDYALEASRRVVDRMLVRGPRFAPPFHENNSGDSYEFSPSLFLGLAGVGYTLLRLANPELLPSVLLLEPQNLVHAP